jgi:hypothetical protein
MAIGFFFSVVLVLSTWTVRAEQDRFMQLDQRLVQQFFGSIDLQGEHGNQVQHWRHYLSRPHPTVATLKRYFSEAGEEFNVPAPLLEAIGQVENNWTQIGPSVDQGWGIMHLVQNSYCDTLGEAAALLQMDSDALKNDPRQNIRGAAALLAHYRTASKGEIRTVEDWFPVLERFSGLLTDETRNLAAQRYYEVLRDGVNASTLWGEKIQIESNRQINTKDLFARNQPKVRPPSDVRDATQVVSAASVASTDYPAAVFDSAASCNYGVGRDHSIDTWVNHWIGVGTYAGAISWFKTCPGTGPGQRGAGIGPSSAHFVIRASDGQITQMVRIADTAWHAGAVGYPYNNTRSIGVEHEATAANPDQWNNPALLQASTTMARYFCNLYAIPKTRSLPGIRGHNEMPGTGTDCPGTLPWNTWMSLLNGSSLPDLTIIEPVVVSPTSMLPGGTVRVDWTEKNNGTVASAPAHNTKICLSTSAYGTTYQIVTYLGMPTLGAGAMQGYYDNIVVPASIPAGDYYVTAFIDCDLQVSEGNENNNIGSSSPSKLTVGQTQTRIVSLSGNLTFGNVPVGNSSTSTMTISNSGNSMLTVSSISYPNGFSGNWSGGTIAANGGSRDVTVTFSPTSASSYGGTITINSDKTSGTNTISASGTGTSTATRVISLSGNLAFGNVQVGNSTTSTMTISNSGNSTLTVSSISYPNGFSGNWSGGTIAANGGTRNVTVTFSPTSASSYGGTITVNSDKTSGTNTISASGAGTANPNPPTVQTLPASSVTSISVVINGTVTNDGGAPVDGHYFSFWDDVNPSVAANDSTIAVQGNNFSTNFIQLQPNTAYHYQAYAHNNSPLNVGVGVGWGVGAVVSFRSAPFTKPDFNADRQADIVWQNNATGQRTIWLMNGKTWNGSEAYLGIAGLAWQIVGTGDFDGDGSVDIVWQNSATGQCTIWLMNGATWSGKEAYLGVAGLAWKIAGAGDFDGDGKVDIIWQNNATGQRTIWLMNGTSWSGREAYLGVAGVDWQIAGTGDFDGDGKVDLLWQNTRTSQCTIWLMNGTNWSGREAYLGVAGLSWKIAGVGDFDGDGKVDIIWQNNATGQCTIWLMNGTSWSGKESYLGVAGLQWEIRNH